MSLPHHITKADLRLFHAGMGLRDSLDCRENALPACGRDRRFLLVRPRIDVCGYRGERLVSRLSREQKVFRNVHIERFRGVSDLSVDGFSQFNVFVGGNNSGKTTVLEALFLLTGPTNPELPVTVNKFRGLGNLDENTWSTYFNGLDTERPIAISGFEETTQLTRELEIRPKMSENRYSKETPTDETESAVVEEASNESTRSSLLHALNGLSLHYVGRSGKQKAIEIESDIQIRSGGVVVHQNAEYSEQLYGIYLSSTNKTQNIVQRFSALQVRKEKSELIAVLQRIEPSLVDIVLGSNNTIYVDTGLEELMPLNVLGDGLIRIISTLITIIDAKNGHVFIDEIENGLHHSSLSILWEAVLAAARRFNVQVFCSTHSYDCIRALVSVEAARLLDSDAKLFRIEKHGDAVSAVDLDIDVLQHAMSEELEVR